MHTKRFLSGLVGLLMIVVLGCSSSDKTVANANEEQVFIVDRDGRKWDVTHARDKYNMNPEYFNFGIGVGSIPSVDNPVIVDEGDPDYPESTSNLPVFGVNYNEEQRAYPVTDMTRHEVFNEEYPGESDRYVAVAY